MARFQPGDPKRGGRKAGVPNKANLSARLRVEQEADPVGVLIRAANTGKVTIGGEEVALTPDQHLNVVRELRRIAVPDAKSATVRIDLPAVKTAPDVLAAIGKVVAEMASGQLAPDEAAAIAAVLEGKRKAIETVEIEERLARLEGGVQT